MLDEELNQTAVKAKAIAEIVEIALNNLMKVDLSRGEALAGILSQIAIQVDTKDLEFALDLNRKYHKSFLENIKKKSIVIDMSSTKPITSKKINEILKKKEIYFLDAPVSGGTSGAKNGNLAIMVGGEKEVFNKALNLLNTMGNPTLVGPIGCGQIAKLANQIIVGITIGAVAEAIHLCKKAGADPNKFIKAVEGGFADSKILKNHGKKMIENNFEPGGKTSTHLKDMNNILESAENVNFKLPISKLIKEMYQNLVNNNHSDKDHSSLYIQIEELNRNGK